MSEQNEDAEPDPEELLEDAMEDFLVQSDVNPNVYYFDKEEAIKEMDGLHQVLFLDEEERQRRRMKPAGHSMEDLKDMPDQISMEALVEAEYGNVLDRRWLDMVEKDIDADSSLKFYGGAYLVEEEGHEDYVVVGTNHMDGKSMQDQVDFFSGGCYEDLDELVEDNFRV
jgi:hypothetical protein